MWLYKLSNDVLFITLRLLVSKMHSKCDMFSLYPCSWCYPLPSSGNDVVLRQKLPKEAAKTFWSSVGRSNQLCNEVTYARCVWRVCPDSQWYLRRRIVPVFSTPHQRSNWMVSISGLNNVCLYSMSWQFAMIKEKEFIGRKCFLI
jgi:hypothetical protein